MLALPRDYRPEDRIQNLKFYKAIRRYIRDTYILGLRLQGYSVTEITQKYCLNKKTVYKALKREGFRELAKHYAPTYFHKNTIAYQGEFISDCDF